MIEVAIISFSIGAVLGYRYGLEAGYNEASRENERADKLEDLVRDLADKD